jgi:hypothetical protein
MMAALIALTGCASIVSKSEWPVTFNSTPQGAEVIVKDNSGNEINRGITPTTFTLKSSKAFFTSATYYAEFQLDEYQTVKTSLQSNLNGWYLGNICLSGFGLIGGLIIDPATGAMYKLPPQCSVNLVQQGQEKPSLQSNIQK